MEQKSNWQIINDYLPIGGLLLALAALVVALVAFSNSRQAQRDEAQQEVVTWSDYRQLQDEIKNMRQQADSAAKQQVEQQDKKLRRLQRQIEQQIDTRWQELEEAIDSGQLALEETDRQQQIQLDVLQESVNSLQFDPNLPASP